MEIKYLEERTNYTIKITLEDEGKEIGRVRLCVFKNELHPQPFGLMEDLFVEEVYRKQGLGKKLVEALVERARVEGCYKIILTIRSERTERQIWYQKIGFKNWGVEMRMDLI